MTGRFLGGCAVVLLASSVVHATREQSPVKTGATRATSISQYRPVAVQYCVTCHNERRKTAGLALDAVDFENVASNAETWEKVLRKLRSGAMPPLGSPRPDAQTYAAFAASVDSALDGAAAAHPNPGHVPALHRLNRAEYTNAIRDLLAVDFDGASMLPPDDSGFGFDNIADVLSVSPMLMERYMSAALNISRIAVGDPSIKPTTDIFAVNKYLRQDDRVGDTMPFGSRGGLQIHHTFPVDGDYVVKIFFTRTYDGRVRGFGERHDLEIRLNGERVKVVSVGGGPQAPDPDAAAQGNGGDDDDKAAAAKVQAQRRGPVDRQLDEDGMEVRIAVKAGPGDIAVSFLKRASKPEGMLRPAYSVTSYEYAGDASVLPGIANIELRGPYDVKGSGDSPSRRRIFTCHPTSANTTPCARQILSTLARRAYRRPVTEDDLGLLMNLYAKGSKNSTFDAGIQMALERILIGPDFLFRAEHDPAGATPGTLYRLTDLELASRLSFFLWSSIPDDELLAVATRGELKRPAVLEAQVRRMLADSKAGALVENFGGQWLYLRNIALVSPDPYAFPDFDENLRNAFQREAELFLESQIREDHGVVDLLTADYTFVNERLAKHYGIPNVYGTHFRRVTLTDDARKGLLGKGGILTLTSYANRTAPTLRGKWLLENILGSPPPPPPPNVPSLKETGADIKNLSMRERMEQHRQDPVCASCHKQMDPIGFALENFDAVGHWRTVSEAGKPIDASGQLADGTRVDGPATLRNALVSHPEQFVTTATEKLLTYALGRGAEYYDGPAVRQVMRAAASDNYRWSALILGIVKSTPFQMRIVPMPATASGQSTGLD